MATYLDELILDEVSLVPKGANKHALVSAVVKSKTLRDIEKLGPAERVRLNSLLKDGKSAEESLEAVNREVEKNMDVKKMAADLEAATKAKDDALAKAEKAEKELADLQKALGSADGVKVEKSDDGVKIVVEKGDDPEMIDIGGEKVLKSSVPAAVVKALEAQAADIAKMKEAAVDATFAKTAAAVIPNLSGTNEEKGQVLKAFSNLSKEAADKAMEMLKAADAIVAKSFDETGGPGDDADADDPAAKLEKMAADLVAADPKLSHNDAFMKALNTPEGAKLYSAIN